jgi:predicted AAA+ superfamily ATPase
LSGTPRPTGWTRCPRCPGGAAAAGGVDRARDILLANTLQFARGLPANNALLWGARGMGKSSLVKAVHAEVVAQGLALKLVEIQREDLPRSAAAGHLRARPDGAVRAVLRRPVVQP